MYNFETLSRQILNYYGIVDPLATVYSATSKTSMNQQQQAPPPPQLPQRPGYGTRPDHPLRLPSFTSLSASENQGQSSSMKDKGRLRQNKSGSSVNGTHNVGNYYYTSMLENIDIEDTEVLNKLMAKLMRLRDENEDMKQAMWDRVSTLSNDVNKGTVVENDDEASLETLRKRYAEKKSYNEMLRKIVDEYEDEITRVLDTAVKAKVEVDGSVIDKIRESETNVDNAADEMWKSWNNVAIAMDVAGKLADNVAKSQRIS